MYKLDNFELEYLEEIRAESTIHGKTCSEYFFESMLDRLVGMGEIVDPQIIDTVSEKTCRNRRKMSVDGVCFDEGDKSIILFYNDFVDQVDQYITKSEIEKYCTSMLYFLEEVYDDEILKYFDASNEIVGISDKIYKRINPNTNKTKTKNTNEPIERIKLVLVTNKRLSDRVKSFEFDNFKGIKVVVDIWSIQRIHDIIASGRLKEDIVIDIPKFGFDGIQVLKASMSGDEEYDAYLGVISGVLLHKLYYEFGSKLLEGNIRAFLSNKGKVNKGIKDTIYNKPNKFFTYNNGIACTASNVNLSDDGTKITKIENMQIINGGQTTASLTSAVLDKVNNKRGENILENIFVPLKLTVIKSESEIYDDTIADIARFANSQNKVTDADLFSNHPFHRRMEELSKKVIVKARENQSYDTLWYYERSRGKYEQEKFKLTKSEQSNFDQRYDKIKGGKKQIITKEELAKYCMSAMQRLPFVVAKGQGAAMSSFAKNIDALYKGSPQGFDENLYKQIIVCAILYRETDRIVATADWYNKGGYKLNIVPYTVSKFMDILYSVNLQLDFEKIWKNQGFSDGIKAVLDIIAKYCNNFIQDSRGKIVTEYCKQESTWSSFRFKRISTVDV